jgi:ATPase family associated with various cellular activities (AAA)
VDELKTSSAARITARRTDAFRAAAKEHRADVDRIRELSRRRRLRYLLYLNIIVLAWLVKRVLDGNPIELGLPSLGPDAFLWAFPLGMIVIIGLAVILPYSVNSRSPHIRFSPSEIGISFADVRGLEIVLEEVTRTLQIFLTYKSFKEELGGNPRRGLLFEGRPGTGKTHMAKAMAAEAGVPFFFVSAPAFQSGSSSRLSKRPHAKRVAPSASSRRSMRSGLHAAGCPILLRGGAWGSRGSLARARRESSTNS